MTERDIKTAVLESLRAIAPEADVDTLEADVTFHDQFEIDSMDFVNFVSALGKALQRSIPEEDYYQLGTLNGCIRYFGQ
ncbi:MAG: acyl carrier protein [Candidatus Competibacteraceae bacterium]|nr:acyl carrier protein [Candidatus Competibacteraceae bacterium]MCB1809468.1 acyl carrier protein [Candidatus Competibacteraceae bacterium]MCB1815501.1 acyl carrier protein [Candidatus Competibacteraceae bacterium]